MEKNSGETSAADDTVQEPMGGVEVLGNEGGTLKVVQHDSLRSVFRWAKGLERHLVLRWPNCNIFPLDFKVPNTTTFLSSSDYFNCFLKAFFVITLSLGLIKILYETCMMSILPSIYNRFPVFAVAIAAAVIAAAAIVKKKMKNTAFTAARKEEVKTVSGLIQQV